MNQKPIIINFYIDMLDKKKKIIHRAFFFHDRYGCETDSTMGINTHETRLWLLPEEKQHN